MSKLVYLKGLLRHFPNSRISKFAFVDNSSHISKRARIYFKSKILKSNIGAFTYIGPRTQIVRANIGKFCSISYDCNIGLASHSMNYLSTSPIFTSKKNGTGYRWVNSNSYQEGEDVIIGNDVWVGTKVIIMGGLKIGNGAIIGAGSIVTKDVPDYAIVAGVPAKIIKYRFNESIIKKLLQLCWWDLPSETIKQKIASFSKDKIVLIDLDDFTT